LGGCEINPIIGPGKRNGKKKKSEELNDGDYSFKPKKLKGWDSRYSREKGKKGKWCGGGDRPQENP